MTGKAPVVVAITGVVTEASVIKSLLESYHIPCHYSSEIPDRIYPVSVEGLTGIRIYVPAALASEARQILNEHRRKIHLHLVEVEGVPRGSGKRSSERRKSHLRLVGKGDRKRRRA